MEAAMHDTFWLDDAAWSAIEPLLPTNQPGAHRVDDRRVISGIMHILRCGCRWKDCPAIYGPPTTIYNRFNRWSRSGLWQRLFAALVETCAPPVEVAIDSSYIKAHRSAAGGRGGARVQAIGPSRGGRTTKVHVLTDIEGRPYVFLLTPGNVADISVAPTLVTALPKSDSLIGDKGYDANSLRRLLDSRSTAAIIPSRASRKFPLPLDQEAYRQRNVIERMFCRLKDFRRIATRYDKLARNFLAAVCLVAALVYWIN
jgi:transposase